jgi:hypothetical protein
MTSPIKLLLLLLQRCCKLFFTGKECDMHHTWDIYKNVDSPSAATGLQYLNIYILRVEKYHNPLVAKWKYVSFITKTSKIFLSFYFP